MASDGLSADYSSASGGKYFGWNNVSRFTPSRLAVRFIEQFPDIAAAGKGTDWLYSGWYQEMLSITYPDLFPIAYADWDLPENFLATTGGREGILIALPPLPLV